MSENCVSTILAITQNEGLLGILSKQELGSFRVLMTVIAGFAKNPETVQHPKAVGALRALLVAALDGKKECNARLCTLLEGVNEILCDLMTWFLATVLFGRPHSIWLLSQTLYSIIMFIPKDYCRIRREVLSQWAPPKHINWIAECLQRATRRLPKTPSTTSADAFTQDISQARVDIARILSP